LSKAYCRKTIDQDGALTVQHAEVEGWEGDAAYEEFGLESYIGSKVVVDGEIYGTFCFAGSEPRDRPFSEDEETFVELMAKWVSYELFQQRATEQIKEQRDQLEEFTSVVSHDLRNPLSIIDGYLDLAEKTGDPPTLIAAATQLNAWVYSSTTCSFSLVKERRLRRLKLSTFQNWSSSAGRSSTLMKQRLKSSRMR